MHRTYLASDIFAQIDLSPVIYLLGFALAYDLAVGSCKQELKKEPRSQKFRQLHVYYRDKKPVKESC